MEYLFPNVTKYELPQLNATWYEFKYSLYRKFQILIKEIIIDKKSLYVSNYILIALFIKSISGFLIKTCGFLYHLFENYIFYY